MRIQSPEFSSSGLPANSDLPVGGLVVQGNIQPRGRPQRDMKRMGDTIGRGAVCGKQEDPTPTPVLKGELRPGPLWSQLTVIFFPRQNKSGFLYIKVSHFYDMVGHACLQPLVSMFSDQESWTGDMAVPGAARDGWLLSVRTPRTRLGGPDPGGSSLAEEPGENACARPWLCPAPAPPRKGHSCAPGTPPHAPLGRLSGPLGTGSPGPGAAPAGGGGEGSCPGVCGRLWRLPVHVLGVLPSPPDASSPLSSLPRKWSQGRGSGRDASPGLQQETETPLSADDPSERRSSCSGAGGREILRT